MNIFEQATRLALRYESPKGLLTVEDLWQLPLTTTSTAKANLDDIAKNLYRELKNSADTVSFVSPAASNADKNETQLRFDVVKYIIDVKVAERDKAAEATKRRETKQRILELIDQKKDQELAGKSVEELTALANSL